MESHVENLATLYQGAITATVRIQARRQQVGNAAAFRQRMKDVLAEIAREAARRDYTSEHTAESTFAFVAFLDEVILSSDDACRDDWAKRPLQEDLFGISDAGEQFFSHLNKLLAKPETPETIDVLEVYYLCLLLGFQGLYINRGRAELQLYADRIQERIRRFRGIRSEISPGGTLPAEPVAAGVVDPQLRRIRGAALSLAGIAVLCFLAFTIHLFLLSANVNEQLLRSVTP